MNPLEFLTAVKDLTKKIFVVDEKISTLESEVKDLRKECAELRKEMAGLTTRIAVQEEGRRTVAAEVKVALTETIAAWEIERIKREAEQEKAQLRREIASSRIHE